MSFQAMSWAVVQKTANAGQKLVLLMLANHCNSHTGQCNPSHKLLAEECSMGISTLKNHLIALSEQGYLRIVAKQEDGVSLPNQYILNLEGVGQNLAGGGSESDRGVGQNLATKQEDKPVIEPVNRYSVAVDRLRPLDVDQQVWNDWLAIRKAKKLPLTETAWRQIQLEADKAGLTMDTVIKECCLRGWGAFKASWWQKESTNNLTRKTQSDRNEEIFHGLTRGIFKGDGNVKLIGS